MRNQKGERNPDDQLAIQFSWPSFFNFNDSGSRVSVAPASWLAEYANSLPQFSPALFVFILLLLSKSSLISKLLH